MLLRRLPLGLLAASLATWIIVVGRLVIRRHDQFATFDFDLGIHDQSLWLLAHGKSFNTVCGLPVFGHHAMFAYYALVPLVWLGGGPNLWNALQVWALAASAIPVFLIGRHRLGNDWPAAGFAIAWLLLPTTTFLAWETLHPETMAIPFFLMGYHYATTRPEGSGKHVRNHNLLTVAWIGAAMLWKEDVALAVMGLALVLLCRHRRRFGLALLGGSALYFLVIGVWMVPKLAGDITAYSQLYGELGHTPMEVATTSLRHPSLFFRRMSDGNFKGYLGQFTSPLGFLPFLAPLVLVMALPQVMINMLTINDFTRMMQYHYQAIPTATAMVAAVEGAAWLSRRRRWVGAGAAAVAIVSSVIATSAWGILPYGGAYRDGYWAASGHPAAGWQAALKRVGPTDVVSAYFSFVPHVTHRDVVYTFPNPWIRSNYLDARTTEVPTDTVQWLVLPLDLLKDEEKTLLDSLLARGEFGDAHTVDGVTTYRRLAPAPGPPSDSQPSEAAGT